MSIEPAVCVDVCVYLCVYVCTGVQVSGYVSYDECICIIIHVCMYTYADTTKSDSNPICITSGDTKHRLWLYVTRL
jgi:hypothetical protein